MTRKSFLQRLIGIFMATPLLPKLPANTPADHVAKILGAKQVGSSLRVSPLTRDVWAGDLFYIEGMNAKSGASLRFCITENAKIGASEILIFPPIIPEPGAAVRLVTPLTAGTTAKVSRMDALFGETPF